MCWVSIHALRVECDGRQGHCRRLELRFNPRTPCGVRHCPDSHRYKAVGFQSTHSVWSATHLYSYYITISKVSIHALRVECDPRLSDNFGVGDGFNPRTPCGVRHQTLPFLRILPKFQSTHSVWSATLLHPFKPPLLCGFNPRTPCGVRPSTVLSMGGSYMFQSTHSVWSATSHAPRETGWEDVSIHALRVECDISSRCSSVRMRRFNPRTPCGVRLPESSSFTYSSQVSIHALRVECDRLQPAGNRGLFGFNPRTPCGVRLDFVTLTYSATRVSIHALRVECDDMVSAAAQATEVSIHALRVECDATQPMIYWTT